MTENIRNDWEKRRKDWPTFPFPSFSFPAPTQNYLNSTQIWIQLLCAQPNKTYAPAWMHKHVEPRNKF
jgi:hypothetical protein